MQSKHALLQMFLRNISSNKHPSNAFQVHCTRCLGLWITACLKRWTHTHFYFHNYCNEEMLGKSKWFTVTNLFCACMCQGHESVLYAFPVFCRGFHLPQRPLQSQLQLWHERPGTGSQHQPHAGKHSLPHTRCFYYLGKFTSIRQPFLSFSVSVFLSEGAGSGVSLGENSTRQQKESFNSEDLCPGLKFCTCAYLWRWQQAFDLQSTFNFNTNVWLQVCDYYKDCLRVLDNSECVPGRIQKEWRKLVSMKISYFRAITHVRPPHSTTSTY